MSYINSFGIVIDMGTSFFIFRKAGRPSWRFLAFFRPGPREAASDKRKRPALV
jgi:hypothetical protein